MSVLEIDYKSQYIQQGRIYKKFDTNLFEPYVEYEKKNFNINLSELDNQISDGIVYADEDGKTIYKFGAKKIIQTAITKGLSIDGLDKKYYMDYYSFWVPDLYFISMNNFHPNSDLYIGCRRKDLELLCLTNLWDSVHEESKYLLNDDEIIFVRGCTGRMMENISSEEFNKWKLNPIVRASEYVNKFISSRGNADLSFWNSKLRRKVPKDLKKYARFLASITTEQENVNTYEDFIKWSKTTSWLN